MQLYVVRSKVDKTGYPHRTTAPYAGRTHICGGATYQQQPVAAVVAGIRGTEFNLYSHQNSFSQQGEKCVSYVNFADDNTMKAPGHL